jgi:polysaccharide pyruvyl transferase WcaK-like protein
MKKKKQVTIIYGLPDTNAGGAALGISLVNLLKKKYLGYTIKYMSSHGDKRNIKNAYPFFSKYCPDVEIVPFPYKRRNDYTTVDNKIVRAIFQLGWIKNSILSLIIIFFPNLFRKNRSLKILKDSEIIIGRGTQIFYDHKVKSIFGYIKSVLSKYDLCFPLLYATRINVPFVIYPQSFGPLYLKLNRKLISRTFKDAEEIMCREEESYKFLVDELRLNPRKIRIIPDTVFSLKASESIYNDIKPKYEWLINSKYVVFVIRDKIGKYKNVDVIFEFYKNLISFIKEKYPVDKVIITTQCHILENYSAFEDDSSISKRLHQALSDLGIEVLYLGKSYSPFELQVIYKYAKYLFTVRLHSAILAYTMGTPSFAISYFGTKTTGILNYSGLEKYLIVPDNLDLSKVCSTISEIELDYDSERRNILNKVSQIKANLFNELCIK